MASHPCFFHGDGSTWVNATSIVKYVYVGARDHFARMQKKHFETCNIPHKLLEGSPQHVYLMDMNELYLVAVSLPGWEFMAEASYINAGVRKHASRLAKGVNMGDSIAMGKLVQAGEAVQQPCLAQTVQQPCLSLDQQSLMSDQEVSVWIEGAAAKVTADFCLANSMADVFGIDTSVIADFDKNAVIEKVVQGPPDVQGKWNVCTVMMD
jgi:hypothetical protein